MESVPWLLMAIAVFAAIGYVYLEIDSARRYAAGVFGGALGAALLLWGIDEIKRGRIRAKRVYVSRSDKPTVFLLLVLAKRIVPAIVMLGAAIWLAFFRAA